MSYTLIHNLILAVCIPLGIYSFFRPIILLFLFVGLAIAPIIPTIPYNDDALLEIIRIGSIKIYVHDYLIAIMLLMVVVNYAKNPEHSRRIIKNPVGMSVVMLFLWDIVVGTISLLKGFSGQNILRYFATESIMLMALLIPQIRNINYAKDDFYKFTIYTSLILVIFAFIRYYLTKEIIYTSSGTARTLNANSIILLTLPLCYVLFYNTTLQSKKIISALIVLSLIAGAGLAGYRSGWIVLFFTISMYFLYKIYGNIKLLWMPMLAASLITILLFGGANNQYSNVDAGKTLYSDMLIRVADIFDLENKTTQGRLSTWEFALDIVQNSPVLGLGRLPVYTMHRDESNVNLDKFNELERGAHNVFFEKLIHEGVAGVAVISLFFYVILREAWKLAKTDRNYSRFFLVYFIGFIIFSLMNTSFSSFTGKLIFFMVVGFLNNEVYRINLHKELAIRIA